MSFEDLKRKLLEEAELEAKRLVSSAEKEASLSLSSAEDKLKILSAESLKKAKELSDLHFKDSVSSARLKAKRLISEAKDFAIENALRDVWFNLCELRKSREYDAVLKKLISDGLALIGDDAVVFVNKNDLKIAKKYAKNVSESNVNMVGGAIISKGSVLVDNSFEALFSSKKESLKTLVYTELFGGK